MKFFSKEIDAETEGTVYVIRIVGIPVFARVGEMVIVLNGVYRRIGRRHWLLGIKWET